MISRLNAAWYLGRMASSRLLCDVCVAGLASPMRPTTHTRSSASSAAAYFQGADSLAQLDSIARSTMTEQMLSSDEDSEDEDDTIEE